MSKKHLILSQHQFDLLLHLPVHHLPICHLHHHNNMSCSSEIKENRIVSELFQHSEHVVQHSELKWLLHKSYWIFLNAFLTVRSLDSLLHFDIQLMNKKIRIWNRKRILTNPNPEIAAWTPYWKTVVKSKPCKNTRI